MSGAGHWVLKILEPSIYQEQHMQEAQFWVSRRQLATGASKKLKYVKKYYDPRRGIKTRFKWDPNTLLLQGALIG